MTLQDLEERQYQLQVANIIKEQVGLSTLMSIGGRDLTALAADYEATYPGLSMTVGDGRWICHIELTPMDVYKVSFIKKLNHTVGYTMDMVYFDDLREVLITGLHQAMWGGDN